jgi:hypothetical protein
MRGGRHARDQMAKPYSVAMPKDWRLAQVNIAMPHGPMDSEVMAGFRSMLEPINALADGAPGFIWRLQDDAGDATAIRPFEDERLMINLSVWESVEALWDFVYDSDHLDVMRRRREWFTRMDLYMALWWVPAGEIPTTEDAKERLELLRENGPTTEAFTFKHRFPAPSELDAGPTLDERDPCPA